MNFFCKAAALVSQSNDRLDFGSDQDYSPVLCGVDLDYFDLKQTKLSE